MNDEERIAIGLGAGVSVVCGLVCSFICAAHAISNYCKKRSNTVAPLEMDQRGNNHGDQTENNDFRSDNVAPQSSPPEYDDTNRNQNLVCSIDEYILLLESYSLLRDRLNAKTKIENSLVDISTQNINPLPSDIVERLKNFKECISQSDDTYRLSPNSMRIISNIVGDEVRPVADGDNSPPLPAIRGTNANIGRLREEYSHLRGL